MRANQAWCQWFLMLAAAVSVGACGSTTSNNGTTTEEDTAVADADEDAATDAGQDTATSGSDTIHSDTIGADAQDTPDAPDVPGSDAEDVKQPEDVNQPEVVAPKAPTVTILSPKSGTIVPAGLPLTITFTTADADSPLGSLKVAIDDAPIPTTWATTGPDAGGVWTATATPMPGEHTVTVVVQDETGEGGTDSITFVATDIALPVLTLTPNAPKSDQDLVATVDLGATGVLPLGDVLIDFVWTINGAPVENKENTLGAVFFVGGDEVKVVATLTASAVPGWQVILDASVTIAPSAPSEPTVSLSPQPATVASILECSALATDGDNQALLYSYVWTLNGVELGGAPTGSTLELASIVGGAWKPKFAVKAGDVIACTATANDGALSGPSASTETELGGFDACNTNFSGCGSFSTCSTDGSVAAICTCVEGYEGDGKVCTKIQECGVETATFLEDVSVSPGIVKGGITATGTSSDPFGGGVGSSALTGLGVGGSGSASGTDLGGSDTTIEDGEFLKLTFAKPVSQVEVTLRANNGSVMQAYVLPSATDEFDAAVNTVSAQQASGPGDGSWVTFHWIYTKPVTSVTLKVVVMGKSPGIAVTQVRVWHESLTVTEMTNVATCTTGQTLCSITEAEHIFDAFTLTGSASLNFLNGNGVGVVGGAGDALIDGQETLNLAFSTPVTKVLLSWNAASSAPDPWLEYFDAAGASVLKVQGIKGQLSSVLGKFLEAPGPVSSAVFHANTAVDATGGVRISQILTGTCPSTPCQPGFASDGKTCSDINECANGSAGCALAADCTNTVGSFTCTCKSGYTGDGKTCTPIPECGVLATVFASDVAAIAQISDGGITASSASNVTVTASLGLGVVGGTSDGLIDANEKLVIAYDKPVSLVELTLRAPLGQAAGMNYVMSSSFGVNGQMVSPVGNWMPATTGPEWVTYRWLFPEPVVSTSLTVFGGMPNSGLALSQVTAWAEQLKIVDFTTIGTCTMGIPDCAITEAQHIFDSLTLSGSGPLYFLPLNGVGVVGGADTLVDGAEYLNLDFATPVTKLMLISGLGSGSPDSWVEFFDAQGTSLLSSFDWMKANGQFIPVPGGFSQATVHSQLTNTPDWGVGINKIVYGSCPVGKPASP